MGNPLAAIFIGVPIALAVLYGVMILAGRILKMGPGDDNPIKATVYGVILLATVLLLFGAAAQTGWWE